MNIFFQNIADKRTADFFLNQRDGFGVSFFEKVSLFCDWRLVLILFLIIILFLFFKRKRLFAETFIFIVAGSELLTYCLKIFFARPRPVLGVMSLSDYSFPSGHSSIAVAFYGFLFYVIAKIFKFKGGLKCLWAVLFGLLIILIGLSRLYLGVHYLSDVLAGYFIGLIFLSLGILFSENKIKK